MAKYTQEQRAVREQLSAEQDCKSLCQSYNEAHLAEKIIQIENSYAFSEVFYLLHLFPLGRFLVVLTLLIWVKETLLLF